MSEMVAFCGLICSNCPTFLATRNDDEQARKDISALYAEKYDLHYKPEDINCDGCRSEGGKLIGFCRTCAIRDCGLARGVEYCGACPDQPCEALVKFHNYSPAAKACFDRLTNRLGTSGPRSAPVMSRR
ncbi:MAG: DUF3795 domain-containing protein [Pseudomonadota bacterium]